MLPKAAEIVASTANFSALLTISNAFKNDNVEASNEALRCIANALLLIDAGRVRFIQKEVNGGEVILELLEVCYMITLSPCSTRF